MVKLISEYRCEICNKSHKTEASAKRCENSCNKNILKEEQTEKNRLEEIQRPRLTAKTIPEFIKMINDIVTAWGKKYEKFDLRFGDVWYNDRLIQNNRPIGQPKIDGMYYSGFSLDISYGYTDFSDNLTRSFGLHTGCGNGDGNRATYQAYIFLDDLPLVKSAIEENERKKLLYCSVVNELNKKHKQNYTDDPKVHELQERYNTIYEDLRRTSKALEEYTTSVHENAAKEDFDKIEVPELVNIGCRVNSDLHYPPRPLKI